MKMLLSSITLSIHLLLWSPATGSFRLNWLQTFLLSTDQTITHFGSVETEDIQILSFGNDSRLFTFAQMWSQASQTDSYWETFHIFLLKFFSSFQLHISEIGKQVGESGPYTIQCWISCSMDNTTDLTFRVGGEGEDLVYLNVTERMWVAGSAPHSHTVQKLMENVPDTVKNIELYVNAVCKSLSEIFAIAGKEAISRKIQPQVYVSSQSSQSGTEVICMVTGFYPKPINVSLWNENKMKELVSTETLPNGDETYQITVLANVNVTEQQSVYCQVEHSSLKELLIVHLDNRHRTPNRMVIAITAACILCVVAAVCFVKIYRKRKQDVVISELDERVTNRDNDHVNVTDTTVPPKKQDAQDL